MNNIEEKIKIVEDFFNRKNKTFSDTSDNIKRKLQQIETYLKKNEFLKKLSDLAKKYSFNHYLNGIEIKDGNRYYLVKSMNPVLDIINKDNCSHNITFYLLKKEMDLIIYEKNYCGDEIKDFVYSGGDVSLGRFGEKKLKYIERVVDGFLKLLIDDNILEEICDNLIKQIKEKDEEVIH